MKKANIDLKRILLLLTVALLTCGAAMAQHRGQRRTALTDEQRQKALAEMRTFKHNALTRELDLTPEQQTKFFDVYDEMDEQLMALNFETRELERKTINNENATDTELKAAARALYEQKAREAEIELKYYDRFADVLTARQLAKLKGAERKISLQMASYHGRQRKPRP